MKNILAYLFRLTWGYKGMLSLLLLLGGIDVGLSLLIIDVSKRLIDVATKASSGNLWSLIICLGVFFVVSIVSRNLCLCIRPGCW